MAYTTRKILHTSYATHTKKKITKRLKTHHGNMRIANALPKDRIPLVSSKSLGENNE